MTRRTPAQYNWDRLQFDETILKLHFTPQTGVEKKFVVVHHMVVRDTDVNDDDALDKIYQIWQTRKASAHYGVDGRFVRQYVWDKDYAWATGTYSGNRYGISIEHVNKTLDQAGTANDYLVSDETWKNGAKLAAYIHKRHGMGRPRKDITLRRHSSFKATACPGPYLGGKIWDAYVKEAQRVYDLITKAPAPAPTARTKDFRIHLVPGDKKQTVAQIKGDMSIVNKLSAGSSAVVFNTERETPIQRNAVSAGLGAGWKRVLENENTIAYGSNWSQAKPPVATLLAPQDPSKLYVSPKRYLNEFYGVNKYLTGVPIGLFGTHLLSEANCIHVNVRGRLWREKMWPIQLNDCLNRIELAVKSGIPVVFAGDINTGKYFNGTKLDAAIKARFPGQVVHVHNGALDHIFLISSSRVRLTEVDQEISTDNASNHNMISATIRATVL